MRYVSLFSWIWGFELAIHRAFPEAQCIGYSEIDKYALKTYQKNFPEHVNLWDVRTIDGTKLGKVELLVWWSPCQDLSVAKTNRKGLDWPRSGLFREYVRILYELKPTYFILENVASMSKESKDIISEALGVQPIMIDASLVSAQRRRRLYWTNIPLVKLPDDKWILLKDILEEEVDQKYYVKISEKYWLKGLCTDKAKCLTASCHKWYGNDWVTTIRVGHLGKWWQGERVYSPEGKSVSLTGWWGWLWGKTWLYQVGCAIRWRYTEEWIEQQLEIGGEKSNSLTTVQKDSLVYIEQLGRGYNKWGKIYDKCPTLTSNSRPHNNTLVGEWFIRRLTPLECERLQTFEDWWTEWVSDTQRYKQLGNAVCVDVVSHVLSFIPNKL